MGRRGNVNRLAQMEFAIEKEFMIAFSFRTFRQCVVIGSIIGVVLALLLRFALLPGSGGEPSTAGTLLTVLGVVVLLIGMAPLRWLFHGSPIIVNMFNTNARVVVLVFLTWVFIGVVFGVICGLLIGRVEQRRRAGSETDPLGDPRKKTR